MKPVWIKYYGLIPMTRWGYLITLAVAGAIVLLMLLLGACAGLLPPLDTAWSRQHHVREPAGFAWLHNYFYWIIGALFLAQGIDVLCTMRAFDKKEAEQRARLAAEWDDLDDEGRPDRPAPSPHVHADDPERRPPPTDIRGRP